VYEDLDQDITDVGRPEAETARGVVEPVVGLAMRNDVYDTSPNPGVATAKCGRGLLRAERVEATDVERGGRPEDSSMITGIGSSRYLRLATNATKSITSPARIRKIGIAMNHRLLLLVLLELL